jgi:hypothetical protein
MAMKVLNNRNFIFILAMILGLFLPQPAEWTKVLMIPRPGIGDDAGNGQCSQ